MNDDLIVIKIGSNVLVDETYSLRMSLLENILHTIGEHNKHGKKIVLVTSGAVALGKKFFTNKILDKKLAAGIGQAKLMSGYTTLAEQLDLTVSELLLSRPHLVKRSHFAALQESINNAFVNNIIPIINENDALVYGSDWSFGDNDSLSASLAVAFKADKLLILSHIDGLYTSDPSQNTDAELLNVVKDVNVEMMKFCSIVTSSNGRGGMVSKLKAARICTALGIEVQIINAFKEDILNKALQGNNVGTTFLPRKLQTVKEKERWLIASKSSSASIGIDDGAVQALSEGKSLLAVGIRSVCGKFDIDELVEVVDKDGVSVAIGKVDVDYKSVIHCEGKKGLQVMHADNIMAFV